MHFDRRKTFITETQIWVHSIKFATCYNQLTEKPRFNRPNEYNILWHWNDVATANQPINQLINLSISQLKWDGEFFVELIVAIDWHYSKLILNTATISFLVSHVRVSGVVDWLIAPHCHVSFGDTWIQNFGICMWIESQGKAAVAIRWINMRFFRFNTQNKKLINTHEQTKKDILQFTFTSLFLSGISFFSFIMCLNKSV